MTLTSQVTPELTPSPYTQDDIIGYCDDDDIESMGSDACSQNNEGDDEQQELPRPPPEVVEEVFSSMIDSMPRTKEGDCGGGVEE